MQATIITGRAVHAACLHALGITVLTVLLVEDDDLTRRVIESLLRRRGYAVCMPVSAPFGAGAIRLLEKERIDAVVLDLLLGGAGFDGFELARRMRDHDEWRRIPLFLMSGLSEDEIQERAMNYAFSRLTTHNVGKPINERLLFSALDELRRNRENR